MPFIFLGIIMVLGSIYVFMMAAHEKSNEMAFGGGAILLAGLALIGLFLIFNR